MATKDTKDTKDARRDGNEGTAGVLVIGYGNPLRGDDGAGWYVAERLENKVAGLNGEVQARHQLLPEMAEAISRAGRVIFVDAGGQGTGLKVGEVKCEVVEAADEAAGGGRPMTHQLSPQMLLAYAREFFGRVPPAVLYTIGAESFGHEERLSPAVRAACDALVERLVRELADEAG